MDGDTILDRISGSLNAVFETAEHHDGLVPATLDCDTAAIPDERPEQVPGHRDSEQVHSGASLLDDASLLSTARALDEAGIDTYDSEIDHYLTTFATECIDTETGLFPWGDHAFWNLEEWRIGSCYSYEPEASRGVHDQRLRFPTWLWNALEDRNAGAVQAFADGLDWHWVDDARSRFNRHAWVDHRERSDWTPSERACDFPRHSGTFVHDLAVAYAYEQRPETRAQLERFLGYWWHRRDERGLVPYESEGHVDPSPQQTLALASGFCEAAQVLEDTAPNLATTCRERAKTYVGGVLGAAHDGGKFWGADYPNEVLAAQGLTCLHVWRDLGDDRLLDWACGVGDLYRGLPFPADASVPAKDPGLVLELFADLADVTEWDRWEDAAADLANEIVPLYFDRTIPRAATGANHYDAHLGTGTLFHGLARVALRTLGVDPGPSYVRLSPGYRRTESYKFR